MPAPLLRDPDDLTPAWLAQALGEPVARFAVSDGQGNWSRQVALRVELADGRTRDLRLKLCLGDVFGPSEVDYYTRDYLGLEGAPLVRCFAAHHEPGDGYHLLLEDLSASHENQRDIVPTLAYGLAFAEALAKLHRFHWQSGPAPEPPTLSRYFDEIRPGVAVLDGLAGRAWALQQAGHEETFRRRWADPRGMSLLHGDLNPTNVLAPRGRDGPLYFLDRQPFDWSLTYGLAVSDLAYAMAPWWPEEAFKACAGAVLRRWHECLDLPGYGWEQTEVDWRLSLRQCLDVPFQWCAHEDTAQAMRWLWQAQLQRVEAAMAAFG
ncbi:MAG: phosphotransferase [Pseudomonadota bacterium]